MAFELPPEAVLDDGDKSQGFTLPTEDVAHGIDTAVKDPDFQADVYAAKNPQDLDFAYQVQKQKDARPLTRKFSEDVMPMVKHPIDTLTNLAGGVGNVLKGFFYQIPKDLAQQSYYSSQDDPQARTKQAEAVISMQNAGVSAEHLVDSSLGRLGRAAGTLAPAQDQSAAPDQPVGPLFHQTSTEASWRQSFLRRHPEVADKYQKIWADEDEAAKKANDEESHKAAFMNRVDRARRSMEHAQGVPTDTGEIADFYRGTTGELPSEVVGPQALKDAGAPPVDPAAIAAKSAAIDPSMLLMSAAPQLPGAGYLGGRLVQGAGKALQVPMNLLEAAPGRLGRAAAATGAGAGVILGETALHNPALAAKIGAGVFAAKGLQKMGQVLEAQGAEAATGVPSNLSERVAAGRFGSARGTGGLDLKAEAGRAIGDTAVNTAAGAAGMLPISAATSENPKEFVESELGAGMFGGALGMLHSSRPMLTEALRPTLRAEGVKTMDTTSELGQRSAEYLMGLPKAERDSALETMGALQGLNTEGSNGEKGYSRFYVVDDATYKAELARLHGATPDDGGRGYFLDKDGSAVINGDQQRSGSYDLDHTMGHEGLHMAAAILRAGGGTGSKLWDSMMQNVSRGLMENGKPTDEFRKFIDTYNQAFDPSGKFQAINPNNPKSVEEFMAEHAGRILAGEGASSLALPKNILDKIQEGVGNFSAKALGMSQKIGQTSPLNAVESEQVTKMLRDTLSQVAQKPRDEAPQARTAPTGPEAPPAAAQEAPAASQTPEQRLKAAGIDPAEVEAMKKRAADDAEAQVLRARGRRQVGAETDRQQRQDARDSAAANIDAQINDLVKNLDGGKLEHSLHDALLIHGINDDQGGYKGWIDRNGEQQPAAPAQATENPDLVVDEPHEDEPAPGDFGISERQRQVLREQGWSEKAIDDMPLHQVEDLTHEEPVQAAARDLSKLTLNENKTDDIQGIGTAGVKVHEAPGVPGVREASKVPGVPETDQVAEARAKHKVGTPMRDAIDTFDANRGKVVLVNRYESAQKNQPGFEESGRSEEIAKQSAAKRKAGAKGTLQDKPFIPTEIRVNKDGDPYVNGFDVDVMLSNLRHVADFMRENKLENPLPNDKAIQDALEAYNWNHNNGFDGAGLKRLEQPGPDFRMPKPNQDAQPRPLDPDPVKAQRMADMLNMAVNSKPSEIGGTEAIKAARLNIANQGGMTGAEPNSLRADLEAKGFDTAKNLSKRSAFYGRLSPELIRGGVVPNPDNTGNVSVRPHGYDLDLNKAFQHGKPQFEAVAAGFMPSGGEETSSSIKSKSAKDEPALGRFMPSGNKGGETVTGPEREKNFRKWTGDAPVYRMGDSLDDVETGKPVVIEGIHGTTHDFEEADPGKGNPENNFGKGFYVTTSTDDAHHNYAGEGPDLTNRISRAFDQVEHEASGYDSTDGAVKALVDKYGVSEDTAQRAVAGDSQAIREIAASTLKSHEGASMKVFVKMENPIKLGGDGEHRWSTGYDEETGEETGEIPEFINAVRDAAEYYNGHIDEDRLSGLLDMDGSRASKVILEAKHALAYHEDPVTGDMASGEIVREALQNMGYDGIIDANVGRKFSSMQGVHENMAHVIAFRPEQIKSATGNRGTFDPALENMNFMPSSKAQQQFEKGIRDPEFVLKTLHTPGKPVVLGDDDIIAKSPAMKAASPEEGQAVYKALQPAAQKARDETFQHLLQQPHEPNSVVGMTAGGPASGKTRIAQMIPGAEFVYDSPMGTLKTARDRIQSVVDSGRVAHIVFVARDMDGVARGNLGRALDEKRVATVDDAASSHARSRETVRTLEQEFADDPRVIFDTYKAQENGQPKRVSMDELPALDVDKTKEELHNAINEIANGTDPNWNHGPVPPRLLEEARGGQASGDGLSHGRAGQAVPGGESAAGWQSQEGALGNFMPSSRYAETDETGGGIKKRKDGGFEVLNQNGVSFGEYDSKTAAQEALDRIPPGKSLAQIRKEKAAKPKSNDPNLDQRTRRSTLIPGRKLTAEQSAAAATALRETYRRFDDATRKAAASDEDADVEQAAQAIPDIQLKALGLRLDPTSLPGVVVADPNNDTLRYAGHGGESVAFVDGDVAYKVFVPRHDLLSDQPNATGVGMGIVGDVVKLEQGPNKGNWTVRYNAGTMRDMLEKLHALTQVGGIPTEIVGKTPGGSLVVKQPVYPRAKAIGNKAQATKDAYSKMAIEPVSAEAKASGKLNATWEGIGIVDGVPYSFADLRSGNHIQDNQGDVRLADPVVGRIPDELLNEVPALKEQVQRMIAEEPANRSERQFMPSSGIKLRPGDVGENPEDIGPGNYWLSPDGKFYRAGGDHREWAEARMTNPDSIRKVQMASGRNSPGANAEAHLKDNGWIRISRDRSGENTMYLNGQRATPKQASALDVFKNEMTGWELSATGGLDRNRFSGYFMPSSGGEDSPEAKRISEINKEIPTYNWRDHEDKLSSLLNERNGLEAALREQANNAQGQKAQESGGEDAVPANAPANAPKGAVPYAHWSHSTGIAEIDPARYGSGGAGAERARQKLNPDRFVDRSYLGVGDYKKEPYTGKNKYTGSVDPELIYDAAKDPDDLVSLAMQAVKRDPDLNRTTEFERLIKEHGYLGYRSGNVMAVFHKIPTGQHVGPQEFAQSAPEYAKRSPEMMRVLRDYVPFFDSIEEHYFQPKPADGEQVAKQNEIATAYEKAKLDNLDDPNVRRAYDALATKINDQYDKVLKGVDVEPWADKQKNGTWKGREGQPYKNSAEMQEDIRKNKHLYFFTTTPESFGSKGNFSEDHPMLQDSGRTTKEGYPLLNNDILRAVHDAIAHGAFGSQFGPTGEELAWRSHMATVDDPWARWALTTETRGQNSWVNYRDALLNEDGTVKKKGDEGYVPPQDRPFADQKTDLLDPKYMLTGDRAVDRVVTDDPEFRKAAGLPDTMRDSGGKYMPTSGPEEQTSDGPEGTKWVQRPSRTMAGDVLVNVKVPEFDQGWAKDSEYIPEGGGGAEIKGRIPGFQEWLKKGERIEAPEVHVNPSGTVVFSNGRHRYSYFRDRGAETIPVTMERSSAEEAQKLGMLADDSSIKSKSDESSLGSFMPSSKARVGDEGALQELDFGKRFTPEAMRQQSIKERSADVKEEYPEALPPVYKKGEDGKFKFDQNDRPQAEKVPYNLDQTPLARQAMKGVRGPEARTQAAARAYADKLTEQFNQVKDNPEIMAGQDWYKLARTKIKDHFGDDAILFAQLLGATSARTPVGENFKQALDAYNQLKAGAYEGHAEKYLELEKKLESGEDLRFPETYSKNVNNKQTIIEAGTPVTKGNFKFFLDQQGVLPKQSNSKEFNANSLQVLRVLAGNWEAKLTGPKTPNFARNLSGEGSDPFQATIDVWAARNLHRLGNKGLTDKRWRILPQAESGVDGDDFDLAQAAYKDAAARLGMNPDALQAVIWFAEKQAWKDRGWSRGTGAELSDFNTLLDKVENRNGRKVIAREPDPQQGFDFGIDASAGIGDAGIKRQP